MFKYSKYRHAYLPDLEKAMWRFHNVIHERLVKFETFSMVGLSDVWPLYTHTFKVMRMHEICKISI